MTTNDIDAIRKLTDAATDAPWNAHTTHPTVVWQGSQYDEDPGMISTTLAHAAVADADFIAAARTLVPALCDEIEQLRAERAQARTAAVEAVIADRTAQSTDPDVARAGAFKLEQSLRPWFGPACISAEAMHRVAADVLRSAAWVRPAAPGCDCAATGGEGLAPTPSRKHADGCPAVEP